MSAGKYDKLTIGLALMLLIFCGGGLGWVLYSILHRL